MNSLEFLETFLRHYQKNHISCCVFLDTTYSYEEIKKEASFGTSLELLALGSDIVSTIRFALQQKTPSLFWIEQISDELYESLDQIFSSLAASSVMILCPSKAPLPADGLLLKLKKDSMPSLGLRQMLMDILMHHPAEKLNRKECYWAFLQDILSREWSQFREEILQVVRRLTQEELPVIDGIAYERSLRWLFFRYLKNIKQKEKELHKSLKDS